MSAWKSKQEQLQQVASERQSESMMREIEELHFLKEEIESRQDQMSKLASLRSQNRSLADRTSTNDTREKNERKKSKKATMVQRSN